MSENPKQIIEKIRRMLVTNILAWPMPPPDEMALLTPLRNRSLAYRGDQELARLNQERNL